MKKTVRIICLVLCFALITGCGQQAVEPTKEIVTEATPAEELTQEPTQAVVVEPEPLIASFVDPVSGMEVQHPDGWTPVSNTGSIGVTTLSADWAGITEFKLVYENVLDLAGELAAMKDSLETGGSYLADVVTTPGASATVYGEEWNAYAWTGFYTAVNKDYSGLDVAVPYGKNVVRITAYSPTEEWEKYEPTLRAILNSLVKPTDDYAYIPPVKTTDWTTFTSDKFSLSVSYPPDWQTPIDPWMDQGLWLNSTDWMTSVIIWVKEGTDPAAMLAEWEATQTVFPTLTVTDGEPVTIMGVQYPSKVGEGKNGMGTDINCGVTMVPYDGKMLEILWYAGSGDYWTNGLKVFPGILGAIQGVTSYTSEEFKLSLAYPSTWIEPTAPWTGSGIWLNAPDYMTSVIIWVKEGKDPVQALADWKTSYESGAGVFPSVTLTDGETVTILGEEHPTILCEGKNSMGSDIKCGVTMVSHDGKMLEILWYAGVGDYWDKGQAVFPLILSSIKTP